MDQQSPLRLLLIESSDDHVAVLKDAFSDRPHVIEHVTSVVEARNVLSRHVFSVVLLEFALADQNGFSLVEEIDVPVVLANLPSSYEPIMSACVAGAADFTCGSPSDAELAARLRYLLERQESAAPHRYRLGPYELDVEQRYLKLDRAGSHLTHHETQFLAALLSSPKQFCTYDELIMSIWGASAAVETQNLRVLAGNVRKKIALPTGEPDLLQTVSGKGYKLLRGRK